MKLTTLTTAVEDKEIQFTEKPVITEFKRCTINKKPNKCNLSMPFATESKLTLITEELVSIKLEALKTNKDISGEL